VVITIIIRNRIATVFRSLAEKRALNFTLSMFVWLFV
jgi:hypothetical protein